MEIKSIHTLGREARRENKSLEANPYAEGTEEHSEWFNGWHFEPAARRHEEEQQRKRAELDNETTQGEQHDS